MQSGRTRRVAWIIASALVAVGVVVLIVGLLTPVAFGWFAYQPLSGAMFAPASSGVFLSRTTIVGWIVVTAGCLGLAFLLGRRSGEAQRRSVVDEDRSAP